MTPSAALFLMVGLSGAPFAELAQTSTLAAVTWPISPGDVHVDANQTNGLDLRFAPIRPGFGGLATLRLSGTGPDYVIDPRQNADFARWFSGNRADSAQFMRYFVRCAYPRRTRVSFKVPWPQRGTWQWHGELGLAKGSLKGGDLSEAEQKLVSACLLVQGNQLHVVQPVSLRGNGLDVAPGEIFAMGYPEGVFAGNLFGGAQVTMSMGLPERFFATTAKWRPPGVPLGRIGAVLWAPPPTTYLGRCQDEAGRLGGTGSSDPVHKETEVCIDASLHSHQDCVAAGRPLHLPIFAYGPRLVDLGETDSAADPTKALQVFRLAPEPGQSPPPKPSEPKTCPLDFIPDPDSCVGPYDPLQPNPDANDPCKWLSTWPTDGPGHVPPPLPSTLRLLQDEGIQAVIRDTNGASGAPRGLAFTAIIRFKTDATGTKWHGPEVRVRSLVNGGWTSSGSLKWGNGRGPGFGWLHVYPVYLLEDDAPGAPPGLLSLAVQIHQTDRTEDGPELDAVGFVPGVPACCEPDDGGAPPAWCKDDLQIGVCHQPIEHDKKRTKSPKRR